MSQENGHWYTLDGTPCHWVPKQNGSGNRPTTIADARKLNLLPSVTTILKLLHKPALVDWMIQQACLAVLTSPKLPNEGLDQFVERVLHAERQQDQERDIARDRGTQIHDALEKLWTGQVITEEINPWVRPMFLHMQGYGELVTCEKVLVGDGYAGKTDLIINSPNCWWLWDWKTAKKLPDPKKGAWLEHRLQLAGYAAAYAGTLAAYADTLDTSNAEAVIKPIRTGNVYISTVVPGQFVICEHPDWKECFTGFKALVSYWQFANNYKPTPRAKV